MLRKDLLLQRLNDIGKTLERKDGALFLLGLGSVGIEVDRLDEYSDLDFFVIVKKGLKKRFLDQLDWLEETHPLAYYFKNTSDGYKILFEDGIYGEYAVFEDWEFERISYIPGRIVWKVASFTFTGIVCEKEKIPSPKRDSLDHPLNEALTNLYVGLCRYARGEKLSAMRFVQSYAIDSIISILHLVEQEVEFFPDPFGNERRLEKRFPSFAKRLGDMMQGYHRIPESTIAILNFLEEVFPTNPRLCREIRYLVQHCQQLNSAN
jgi:lincosamide nucleotidyltransferase B/F